MTRRKHEEESTVEKQGKPFEPKVSFQLSATDKILEGYLQLFEAAWEGSAERIKELTLANWGPDQKNIPLMVTVQDAKGFTPFAIAVYRRHFEVAEMILEIANAQFKGSDEETTSRRYTIADDDSDADSEDCENDDLGISSRVVDETYTFDNIATLTQSVGSKVSGTCPLQLVLRRSNHWKLRKYSPDTLRIGVYWTSPKKTHTRSSGMTEFPPISLDSNGKGSSCAIVWCTVLESLSSVHDF